MSGAIVIAVGVRSGDDPDPYALRLPLDAAKGVTARARRAGVDRILVVGGAGSSEVELAYGSRATHSKPESRAAIDRRSRTHRSR